MSVMQTRTRAPDAPPDADVLAGEVTSALGEAWGSIRKRHLELPPAVVILASGADRRSLRWGHWSASRWDVAGASAGEVMIAGELLAPGGGNDPELPVERRVLGTLLHEAAHALAHVFGIKDTSRNGRYHNSQFRDAAWDVGLEVLKTSSNGWSHTRLTEEAVSRYRETLAGLAEVLNGHRVPESVAAIKRTQSRWVRATCACHAPRTIRASRSTLESAPIVCATCAMPFSGGSDEGDRVMRIQEMNKKAALELDWGCFVIFKSPVQGTIWAVVTEPDWEPDRSNKDAYGPGARERYVTPLWWDGTHCMDLDIELIDIDQIIVGLTPAHAEAITMACLPQDPLAIVRVLALAGTT